MASRRLPARVPQPEVHSTDMFENIFKEEAALSLVPLILANSLIIGACCVYAIKRYVLNQEKKSNRIAAKNRKESAMLSSFWRDYWHWLTEPVERFLIRIHATPNGITTFGVVLSLGAAAAYYLGHVGTAGYLVIFSGTCDMFDGRVARATGQETKSGAYYDSVMDRVGEAVVMIGIASYFMNHWMFWVTSATLMGSLLVSYTKARGEGMGVDCNVGMMQRPERIMYLATASLFDPVFKDLIAPLFGMRTDVHYLLILIVIVMAIFTNISWIERMVYIYRELESRPGNNISAARAAATETPPPAAAEPVPAVTSKQG